MIGEYLYLVGGSFVIVPSVLKASTIARSSLSWIS